MMHFEKDYAVICDCKEGIYRVSSVKFDNSQMFYRIGETDEYEEIPGIWGYVDSKGKEIIAPQYIYAFDFCDGLAYVAKGKWERRKEWDDKYWTAEQLWGMINKTGDEVIPCKFDEITRFIYRSIEGAGSLTHDIDSCYLKAHFGGWKEGNWGILDYSGNWVAEPVFYDLDYDIYYDDLIVFQKKPDNLHELYGIYSIKQNRILYEPEFNDIRYDRDTIILENHEKTKETITVKYSFVARV